MLSGAQVTRLAIYGGIFGQYGSFNGKTEQTGAQVTRLAIYGGIFGQYGSFTGKTEQIPPVVEETRARGGFGLPVIVRPIKRHKKLDTFREELDKLINGVQEVAKSEESPVVVEAARELDVIAERFNIVQTFDDNELISSQMEMIRQDFEKATRLIQSIIKQKSQLKQLIAQEEEILLILALETI